MPDGKSFLITGGTDSFGRKYVQTILARVMPKKVVVFSSDELRNTTEASDTALLPRLREAYCA